MPIKNRHYLDTKITIIGAGVLGLAIAADLSRYYEQVFVIEKHKKFGQETSSRNSEVIHSGIYYPKNSLKAKLCVLGREMLYQYCLQKDINHKKCGKIIVATNANEDRELNSILKLSQDNGVMDGKYINGEKLNSLEPNVKAYSGLLFPSTGIIDSYGLMKQFETDAINNGASVVYGAEVLDILRLSEGYEVTINDYNGLNKFTTSVLINSTGLNADKISVIAGINDPNYTIHFWKGEYFAVGNGKGKCLSRLIYPIPNKNTTGLGIHATIGFNGELKLGPNAIYLPNKVQDYSVDKQQGKAFYNSIKSFLPFINKEDLRPDQAGIRPKLQKPGDATRDFIIRNESDKGYNNFINLIGIESPGLTSCLAIASYVRSLIID